MDGSGERMILTSFMVENTLKPQPRKHGGKHVCKGQLVVRGHFMFGSWSRVCLLYLFQTFIMCPLLTLLI